ncbi:MAG: hypothetical protein JW913_02070 [Chitinispirillaceae bacterium]|nr:hypothetical protein [Chitinispirillaceae bacterium]
MIITQPDTSFIPFNPAYPAGEQQTLQISIVDSLFNLTIREILGIQCLDGADDLHLSEGVAFLRVCGQTILTVDLRNREGPSEKQCMVVVANVTVEQKNLFMTIGFLIADKESFFAMLHRSGCVPRNN